MKELKQQVPRGTCFYGTPSQNTLVAKLLREKNIPLNRWLFVAADHLGLHWKDMPKRLPIKSADRLIKSLKASGP